MRKFLSISIFLMILIPCSLFGIQRITFTTQNADFWGYMPGLKAGDSVSAYDPDGILCGEFVVKENGVYGLLHVYADDVSTPIDEGAKKGDVIRFTVNGQDVIPNGPELPVWTEDGARINVNFR